MRRRRWWVAVAAALTVAAAGTAGAGVEPSPFRVNVLKLENVDASLAGADAMLALLLSFHPPEPGTPPDGWYHPPEPGAECHPPDPGYPPNPCIAPNGLAEELRSLAKQVQRLEELVYEVTGDPNAAGDPGLSFHLDQIRDGAEGLVEQIRDRAAADDPKVANALAKLRRNAEALANTAQPLPPGDDEIPPGAGR